MAGTGILAALGVLAAVVTQAAPAQEPICTPGGTTVPITADAKVSSAHPNRHYGRRDAWEQNYGPATARSFVKFELPTIPIGCSVTRATLDLNGALSGTPNPPNRWPGASVNTSLVRHDWTEAGITWNNMPAGKGCTAQNQNYAWTDSWEITGIVQEAYECLRTGGLAEWNGLKAKGWSPRGRGARWRLAVDSRESSHPPVVDIDWDMAVGP